MDCGGHHMGAEVGGGSIRSSCSKGSRVETRLVIKPVQLEIGFLVMYFQQICDKTIWMPCGLGDFN